MEKILVTGATGYLGGRLVPRLLEKDYPVRVMVRNLKRFQGRAWQEQVEAVEGDVLKPDTLSAALEGITTAYYLIHSMSGSKKFRKRDLQAAKNFGEAAKAKGVKRIIYMGGLGNPKDNLSRHLRSRHETGNVLRESGVPVTEFQAAIIVGSGSVSFEMIRYLTERLPVMLCPQWVYTDTQPIGIEDVLDYLISALKTPESAGKIIQIGGVDVLPYKDMMLTYARIQGYKRLIIPLPILTAPRLSSYWIQLITPVSAGIARPLIEGLKNEAVILDDSAKKIFLEIQPMSYEGAVRLALARIEASDLETSWTDALVSSQGDDEPVVLETSEGMLIEKRQIIVDASPEVVFRSVLRIGGKNGWPVLNRLWWLRGFLDSLVGGVGLHRGRRHPDDVRVGDALDFWRVEALEPNQLLRLRAEMKLPGRAWLEFKTEADKNGKTLLTQTAFFEPRGLPGLAYWYGSYLLHGIIFSGMIKALAKHSETLQEKGQHIMSEAVS